MGHMNRNKLLTSSSLNQWTDFEIISQECFLGDCLPKLLKPLCSVLTRWPPELKIEKTFKRLLLLNSAIDFEINLQEGFLGDPLPNLLKLLRFVKQDGRQS